MAISVRCSECGVRAQYPDRLAGRTTACKACASELEIPDEADSDGNSGSAPRAKSGKKKKKAASSQGGLLAAAVLGAFAVVGVAVAGGVAVLFMNRAAQEPVDAQLTVPAVPTPANVAGTPQPATPSPNASNPPAITNTTNSTPVPSGFQSTPSAIAKSTDRLHFVPDPNWKVKADPPAEPRSYHSEKPLKLKLDRNYLRDAAVIYPVTGGDVVGLRQGFGSRVPLELFQISTGKALGKVDTGTTIGAFALSSDGQYVAVSRSVPPTIEVYETKAKKSLGVLNVGTPMEPFRVAVLGIPRPDRLVAISQLERSIRVWELPSGTAVCEIRKTDRFAPHTMHAFSPGGKYIAVLAEFIEKRIEIYNLDDGTLAGTIALEGKPTSTTLTGFNFSDDGREFAVMFDVKSYGNGRDMTQFLVWDVEQGQIASDFELEPPLKDELDPAHGKERLEKFPGTSRWLVHCAGIVDVEQKRLIYSFPELKNVSLDVNRKVMGPDWVTSVVLAQNDARLETLTLDEQTLAAGARNAEAGALAVDSGLPPLTGVDYTQATLKTSESQWQAGADAVPAEVTPAAQVVIEAGTGVVRDVIVTRQANPRTVVRVSIGENANDPRVRAYDSLNASTRRLLRTRRPEPESQKTTLEAFDTASGASQGKCTLPFPGRLHSVSPNGQRILIEKQNTEGRLDVLDWETTAKPRVAWRPYRAVKEDRHRELLQAEFLDDQHVMTLNVNSELVVWSLEPLAPVYRLDKVQAAKLSPGGRWLAVVEESAPRSIQLACYAALTGEGAGVATLDGNIMAMSFHPKGGWLAISHGDEANQHVSVISMENGELLDRIPVPVLAQDITWTGDDFLLLDGKQLLSRQYQAIVWTYESSTAVFARSNPSLAALFALPLGPRWQLRARTLPQPEIAPKISGLDLASLAVVKPGDTVAVELKIGDSPELAELRMNAKNVLTERLTRSQLTVANTAPITVECAAELKTADTVDLRKIGNFQETTPVLRKFVPLKITYKQGANVLWTTERRVSNLDGFTLRLKPGETAQDVADQSLSRGLSSAIASLNLPKFVFGSAASNGLGSSKMSELK